jgi:DNA mismatch repair protein MutL
MLDQFATLDSANIELEATKSIACQSAIKNGMPLSERQIVELLINWLATPRNDTCPHGRPIVLKMTHDKLFQLFHPA